MARALVDPGKAYAVYLKNGTKADLKLEMPAGVYQVKWLNPRTGTVEKKATLEQRGGAAMLSSPRAEMNQRTGWSGRGRMGGAGGRSRGSLAIWASKYSIA